MKTMYKKTIASVLTLTALVAPMSVFADTKEVKNDAAFCRNIETLSERIVGEVEKKGDTFATKRTARLAKLSEKRIMRDEKRATARVTSETKHDKRFESLMKKADTDAKKAAVAAFQKTSADALATRRSAVDEALKKYRDGVDALMGGKSETRDGALTTLKTSISAALSTAKTACANGTPDATVQDTFKAAVARAHETFKSTRTDSSIKADIDTLVAARKQAVEKAIADFKATMDKAHADLKAVLGA